MALATLLLLSFPFEGYTHKKGAPLGSTGGPSGIESCGTNGCHDQAADNTGGGAITITTPAQFEPGQMVEFKVRVAETGARIFGFQATVRRSDTMRPVGSLQTSEGTKFSDAIGDYITHVEAVQANDASEWTFQWQAPGEDVGDIIVYAAGVAGNANGTKFGDNVYTANAAMPISVGVEDEELPNGFSLQQAYPNPFTETTTIAYTLDQPEPVTLTLYDALGRLVTSIDKGFQPAGVHEVLIDASNLSAGSYFYEIQTPHGRQSKRAVKMR